MVPHHEIIQGGGLKLRVWPADSGWLGSYFIFCFWSLSTDWRNLKTLSTWHPFWFKAFKIYCYPAMSSANCLQQKTWNINCIEQPDDSKILFLYISWLNAYCLFVLRYELPQPSAGKMTDIAAWTECVENSQAQLEHQALRYEYIQSRAPSSQVWICTE